jgi:integrase
MANKMEREPLTDRRALALPPPTAGYELVRDGGANAARGLALRITSPSKSEPSGARAWVFCYRNQQGRERRMTIGRVRDWPIKAAREEAARLRRVVDGGGDPLKARQNERAAETIDDLADLYTKEHLPTLRASSRTNAESLLRNWIKPKLGNLRVKDLEHADIARLHARITAVGTPYTANRMIALLRHMLNFAIRHRLRVDNPAEGVKQNQEQKRERYLSGDELIRLMAALGKHAGRPSADAVRILLLTGARRSEVLAATWNQFDLKQGVWTKPSAHTKQNKEHRVPLSGPARAILSEMWAREEALARKEEREPRAQLFPGRGKAATQRELKSFWRTVCGEAGLAERVPQKLRNGKVALTVKGKPRMMWRTTIRVHDLRHSYASSLASAGLSLPIIGALLGHTQTQTTARYAHLAEHVGAAVVTAEQGSRAGADIHTLAARGRS